MMKTIVNGFCNRKTVLFRTLCVAMMVALCPSADAQFSYNSSDSSPVFRSTSSYMPQSSTKRGSYTPVGNGMMQGTSYGRTTAPLFGNTGRNTSTSFNPAGSSRLISNGTFGRNTSSFGRTTSYGNSSDVGASAPARISGRRYSHSDGVPGTHEGEEDGEGYAWDGEEWVLVEHQVGDVRFNPITGDPETWNGSAWVAIGDQREPGTPIGDMPWLLLALAMAAYAAVVLRRRNGKPVEIR